MMTRKKMLLGTGAMLTVPLFLENCTSYGRLAGEHGNEPEANARAQGMSDPILLAINAGITAPNPHNTQAWKFRILSPLAMQLFIDEKRTLPLTDPTFRQIHIGQGTFLEVLSLEAARLGYATRIDLFPEGESTESGKKPVANVTLVKDQVPDISDLVRYIGERATNRDDYSGAYLTSADTDALVKAAGARFCEIGFRLQESMKPILPVLAQGMEIESRSRRLGEESRFWFRFSDAEIQKRRDGIALPDQGISGIRRWIIETFILGPEPEKFFDPGNTDQFLAAYSKKIASARGLVFFKTQQNTKRDWVCCGRDYVRFQLAATGAGLKMHPLSQCLQEFAEMKDLRERLAAMLGQKGTEKIQMIARLGRSDYRYFTPRRSVKEMMASP
ncbi:MAG: hypothetical protein JNM27_05420 [Leptospirales bacterium]|nr:hypothetical protein [Leptospirales bacterium]